MTKEDLLQAYLTGEDSTKLLRELIVDLTDSYCPEASGFEGPETYSDCGKCGVCLSKQVYHKVIAEDLDHLEFTEGEWHYISGRGHVFATKMPRDYPVSFLGKEVIIEGNKYIVRGIEMFAVADTSLFKGRDVGILVRGNRKEN